MCFSLILFNVCASSIIFAILLPLHSHFYNLISRHWKNLFSRWQEISCFKNAQHSKPVGKCKWLRNTTPFSWALPPSSITGEWADRRNAFTKQNVRSMNIVGHVTNSQYKVCTVLIFTSCFLHVGFIILALGRRNGATVSELKYRSYSVGTTIKNLQYRSYSIGVTVSELQ
jgi:hypothetical protein